MFTKPANLQPGTSPAPGHRGAHWLKTALARAPAAACPGRTTAGNVRPLLRRAALAVTATSAAAMMALGPSSPSSAATIPNVNTTNQAGYQAGGHSWNFRYVQAVVKLPNRFGPQQFGCPDSGSFPNYLESSLQLIRPPGTAGLNAAIGIFCEQAPGQSSRYRLGWALGYSGNRHPKLVNVEPEFISGGETVLMMLYYNQGGVANLNDQTLQFKACQTISSEPPSKCPAADDDPFHLNLLDHTVHVPRTFYKQAVLSANVANPLPHPPPPNTRRDLVPFTEAAVTSLNGHKGDPGIMGPWGVQQETERELAIGGNLIAKPVPPPPQTSFNGKAFNIAIFGHQSIGS